MSPLTIRLMVNVNPLTLPWNTKDNIALNASINHKNSKFMAVHSFLEREGNCSQLSCLRFEIWNVRNYPHDDWFKRAFTLARSCCPSPSVHTYNIHMNPSAPHVNPVHRTPDFDSCHRLEVVNNTSRLPPSSIITTQYLTLENWQEAYGLCWLRLQPGQQKTFSAPTSIPLQHMNPVNLLWVHRSVWPPPSFPSSKLPPSLDTIPHLVSAFFPLPPCSYYLLHRYAREFNSSKPC